VAKKSQKHGNPARPTTLADMRARRLFAAMAPRFTRWMAARPDLTGNVKVVLGLVEEFFISYGLEDPGFAGTCLDDRVVAAILDDVSDDGEEVGGLLAATVELYIDFLTETDSWTGSDAQLSALAEVLAGEPDHIDGRAPDTGVPPLPSIDFQPLTQAEALQDIQPLAFVQRATRLLAWVGAGRQVTVDGLPQRKDFTAVAACLAAEAAGSGTAPLLTKYWTALKDSGFIDISAMRVETTPKAAPFLDGSGDLVAIAQELAVALYLRALLPGAFGEPVDQLLSWPRWFHLASAASANPISASAVFNSDVSEGIVEALVSQLRDEVRAWADDGLVTVADTITVPPVLRGPLATAIARADDFVGKLQALETEKTRATFRLRIDLNGMQPPVWRSLDVAASTPLDRLHDDLQLLFDWQDGAPHLFHMGAPGTGFVFTSLNPYDPEDSHDPDEDHDYCRFPHAPDFALEEKEYSLHEIAGQPDGSFTYTYGDDWALTITVTDVLPPRPWRELPVCTEGSGRSPFEGVGGPSEWPKLVAVSQDPEDPLYSSMRRMLHLPPGENIDPGAFDVDRANAVLRGLL
jgi:hypothetical protein